MIPAMARRKQAGGESEQGFWNGACWQGIRTGECGRSRVGEHVARSAEELRCRECHQALLVFVCIVPPAERNLFPIERNQPVIADGNAMGVAAQITKYGFWGPPSLA